MRMCCSCFQICSIFFVLLRVLLLSSSSVWFIAEEEPNYVYHRKRYVQMKTNLLPLIKFRLVAVWLAFYSHSTIMPDLHPRKWRRQLYVPVDIVALCPSVSLWRTAARQLMGTKWTTNPAQQQQSTAKPMNLNLSVCHSVCETRILLFLPPTTYLPQLLDKVEVSWYWHRYEVYYSDNWY